MANFVMGIISLTIGTVVLASVFITTVKNTNQNYTCQINSTHLGECNWSASEIALWGLLTIVGIAGLLYGILNVFGMN